MNKLDRFLASDTYHRVLVPAVAGAGLAGLIVWLVVHTV